MDLNNNLADCVQHSFNIGETVYYNICTGTTKAVPWGSMEWAMGGLMVLLIPAIVPFVLFVLFVVRDMTRY